MHIIDNHMARRCKKISHDLDGQLKLLTKQLSYHIFKIEVWIKKLAVKGASPIAILAVIRNIFLSNFSTGCI
ncbi:hypothetical protein PSYJA_07893 [Pseudomonas syringae pv. japonica str. M301072]|uniref:Uncharacterized protein n=1 Tax=Pseudomonas syringae pv. japonica str. M301072 TaxID=629262 RepID=F3FFA0_PSESX|nr:hypothetical protein PSYJA_07893 [Pseudomonas syringae pv. japonica str. M301072]ELP96420.1 hypothetical protein A979_23057 [Pseudomonas syringae BRIP34876]ELQ02870.1 hypothetical protein A987_11778 [Pseudomonas syringae BRIP34881]